MIRLRVDEAAAIPLAVESASPVSMTVKEEFIDRGGASIQSNKTATPGTAAVEVTPDSGYDALAKVTVDPIPSEYIVPSGTKNITANGTGIDVKAYEKVDVAVPGITPSGTLAIATNGSHDVTNYATAAVAVPASAVDSGTKSITANGNGQDVVGYAAADEGKVVQSGALVSQSSATYTENGTYDTTAKNEVVVDVQGGSSEPVLLASETATEDVAVMSISYDATTMADYKYFLMEIEGRAIAGTALYPCPNLNGASNKGYVGNVGGGQLFHYYFAVQPYFSNNSSTVSGYTIAIRPTGTNYGISGALTAFNIISYYGAGGFQAGTVFKIWGIG